ncbi:ARF GTPase-activating protein GIT1 isoform X5 [Oratosquilla oratoria]|uniref:ARF GTPase-activating protein GIT1 isoform X5 n=1 Tax=Oratosquilla oratoria TaxID=337810 RepID=UPI003F777906
MARLGAGARTKPRTLQDVCADCGAPEPGWASINRGILMCDECCSVHRSLGRHVSQVKSLKKATWNPTLLTMVHRVNSSGANNIWEHTLLDPSHAKTGRRKPQPKDPVHPTKADFIRAKHQMLSFVYRPSREDPAGAEGDVSRQLHSSVRTANLETSLRLLSLGADPNFYHPEKGCCPIHVASRAGQAMQVELLIVYGADPGAVDGQGNSPSHYASEGGYPEIAARLEECQYELTDSLAFYLCGRKPDHISGQHWIIPEMADSLDMSDLAKEARVKLQNLPNHLFEELACDVYDEVDRRETDSIWLSLQNQSALVSDRCTVPFLPVNPEYSSTRNQGRQKLARFNAREFATLIIDVLSDCKRRQTGISSPATTPKDKAAGWTPQEGDNSLYFSSSSSSSSSSYYSPSNACHSAYHLTTNPCYDNVLSPAFGNMGEGNSSSEANSMDMMQGNPLYHSYDEVSCSLDALDAIGTNNDDYCKLPSTGDAMDVNDFSNSSDQPSCIGAESGKYSSGFSSNSGISGEDNDYDSVAEDEVEQLSSSFSEGILRQHDTNYLTRDRACAQDKSSLLGVEDLGAGAVGKPPSGPRSLLVRTLTLPLKYASQHRASLSKVFSKSRSQPSTPELPRKNQCPNKASHMHFVNKPNIKINCGPKTRSSSTLSRQASFRKPFLDQVQPLAPPSTALDSWPSEPCNNPILETCATCSRNVAANIQHINYWDQVENLPRGYLNNIDPDKVVQLKSKARDDCKLQ